MYYVTNLYAFNQALSTCLGRVFPGETLGQSQKIIHTLIPTYRQFRVMDSSKMHIFEPTQKHIGLLTSLL